MCQSPSPEIVIKIDETQVPGQKRYTPFTRSNTLGKLEISGTKFENSLQYS